MTQRQELESLFPLKVKITDEMIAQANIVDSENCIGALALRSALFKNNKFNKVVWVFTNGYILMDLGEKIDISTSNFVNLVQITEPTTVTFILAK